MKKEAKTAEKKSALSWYKRMDFSKKTALWGVIFLLPWLFGLIFFFLRPFVNIIWYSLCDMQMVNGKFIGALARDAAGNLDIFKNFNWVVGVNTYFNQMFVEAFTNMLKEVPFQIFLALFIAMLLNGEYRGRGFFRAIFVIPIILATGVATANLSSNEAVLAVETAESVMDMKWLEELVINSGIPQELTTILVGYVENIFTVVTTCGVQVLLFLAGLQAISPSLYEVAKMEGCTQFEIFCKITLPMVSPTILVCLVYSIAESFANAMVTYGDQTVKFSSYIYDITFQPGNEFFGYGAAASVIYTVLTLATVGIICGIVSKGVFYYD